MLQEGAYSAAFQTCLAGYKGSRDMLQRILGHAGMCTASEANESEWKRTMAGTMPRNPRNIKGKAHLGTITFT